MTRINVVHVSELCDKHLLSEHRELTRIPNNIVKGKFSFKGQPGAYVLGEGHMKFFYSRLTYLFHRYQALHAECVKRGFRVQYIWPENLPSLPIFWGDYTPTPEALAINRARIQQNMPKRARFTRVSAWGTLEVFVMGS